MSSHVVYGSIESVSN